MTDLADAHLRALTHLRGGGDNLLLNCGYGHGFSVRDVIAMVKRVSGVDFPVTEAPRRAGDPAALVARADKLPGLLGWQPRYNDLETIVRHALEWERRLA